MAFQHFDTPRWQLGPREALVQRASCWATAITSAAGVAGLALVGYVIALIPRGFDLTDDAFYVLSARHPEALYFSISSFGYLLKPLFYLCDGNIASYRRLGVGVACAAAALAWLPWSGQFGSTAFRRTTLKLGMASLVAAMPLAYYAYWIPTPSYNWSVLLAGLLLFGALGSLLQSNGAVSAAMFAGAAGVIALLAKPPSAVVFAIIYLTALAIVSRSGRCFFRHLALATAVSAVFLIVVFSLVVPVETAIERHRTFFNLIVLPGHLYRLGNMPQALLAFVTQGPGVIVPAALAAYILAMAYRVRPARVLRWAAIAAILVSVAIVLWNVIHLMPWRATIGIALPSFAAIALAAVMVAVPYEGDAATRTCALLGLALLIPVGAAFGTSNYLPSQMRFFAGIPAIVLLEAARRMPGVGGVLLAGIGVALVSSVAVLLAVAAEDPYRIATPLRSQNVPLEITPAQGVLSVDPATKHFVETLRNSAVAAGLRLGQPIFDLTGRNPGLVLALGGEPPVSAWLHGGYPVSPMILAFAVSHTPAEVRRNAWLIWGDVPAAFTREVVEESGFSVERDYRSVACALHPITSGMACIYAPKRID
jgi:hypothetical protein